MWGGRGRHVKLCLGHILWYKPNHSTASAAVRCASPWTTDQSPRALLTDTEMLHCPTWLFLPVSLLLHVKQWSTVPLPASQEERAGYHELSGCYVPGLWSLRTVRAQSFSVHQHFTGKHVSAQCVVKLLLNWICKFLCILTSLFIVYLTNVFAVCVRSARPGQVVTLQWPFLSIGASLQFLAIKSSLTFYCTEIQLRNMQFTEHIDLLLGTCCSAMWSKLSEWNH